MKKTKCTHYDPEKGICRIYYEKPLNDCEKCLAWHDRESHDVEN